jgi:hypothetical protein
MAGDGTPNIFEPDTAVELETRDLSVLYGRRAR